MGYIFQVEPVTSKTYLSNIFFFLHKTLNIEHRHVVGMIMTQ